MSEDKKSSATAFWTFIGTLGAAVVACLGTITAAGIATVPNLMKELNPVTPIPATAVPNPTASSFLFQDNFSSFDSGWMRSVKDTSIVDYYNGGYRIYIKNPGWLAWSTPDKNFTDVRIEAYATKLDGPDENGFGVICRYLDDENYYYFLLTSDGYAGIGARKEDVAKIISSEKLPSVSAIKKGRASNHIRADCVGTTMTLFINGERIVSARDAAFAEGDVGLFAKSYDAGGVDMLFDNFSITQP